MPDASSRAIPEPVGDYRVNLACFATVWLAAAAMLVVAVPTLLWAAFALWQMPAHRGVW